MPRIRKIFGDFLLRRFKVVSLALRSAGLETAIVLPCAHKVNLQFQHMRLVYKPAGNKDKQFSPADPCLKVRLFCHI